MLAESIGRVLAAICLLAVAISSVGCRTNHQPFTNPLGADRVPAPATRVIQPGTAQPYYPGDALPATGLPATGLPATGQIVAPEAGFGAAAPPAAFGQQQQPIVQAQPFTAQPFTAQPLPAQPFNAQQPATQPQTFAQPQPLGEPAFGQPAFGQPTTPAVSPLPATPAPTTQPFTPSPYTPQAFPQGRADPPGGSTGWPNTAMASPAAFVGEASFVGEGDSIAIPSDDQSMRLAVAQQPLFGPAPSHQQPQLHQQPPLHQQQAMQPAAGVPAVIGAQPQHVAVTMTPVSPTGQAVASADPEFSVLPTAAELAWISGSAPRVPPATASPTGRQSVVPAQAVVPASAPAVSAAPTGAVASAPRVRLPGSSFGSVQVTELPASADGFRAR